MNEALLQLNALKTNLERLLRSHTALKNENDILKNQIVAQRKAMIEKNTRIAEIEQQILMLKSAHTVSKQLTENALQQDIMQNDTLASREEVKQKINALIREVDRCIALLNS
jgi:hemerythrin-like domain-containing protein